jgi:hypothetical protein
VLLRRGSAIDVAVLVGRDWLDRDFAAGALLFVEPLRARADDLLLAGDALSWILPVG